MRLKLGLLGLGLLAGVSLLMAGWQFFTGSYTYKGSVIDHPVPAADFELTDQNGGTFRLSDQRGKVVLLFFGYTHCPDVCPVTMAEYKNIKAALGENADEVRFVFITLDPERDTPEVIGKYLANFDPSFTGLTGDRGKLEAVWKDYGVYQEKVQTSGASGYLVDHSAYVYAIDRQGNWRLTYGFGTQTDYLIQDVAHLLLEK